MFSESRRIHLIEEMLKLKNEDTLIKLEAVLEESKQTRVIKQSANDFIGLWSQEDALLIEKAIQDGCEQVNADDWK